MSNQMKNSRWRLKYEVRFTYGLKVNITVISKTMEEGSLGGWGRDKIIYSGVKITIGRFVA